VITSRDEKLCSLARADLGRLSTINVDRCVASSADKARIPRYDQYRITRAWLLVRE